MVDFGSFVDTHRSTVRVYSSSVAGGFWLAINNEDDNYKQKGHSHLTVNDAKVLIALLLKAIGHLEDDR